MSHSSQALNQHTQAGDFRPNFHLFSDERSNAVTNEVFVAETSAKSASTAKFTLSTLAEIVH